MNLKQLALIALALLLPHPDTALAQIVFSYETRYENTDLTLHVILNNAAIYGEKELSTITTRRMHEAIPYASRLEVEALQLLSKAEIFVTKHSSNNWGDTPGGQDLLRSLQFVDRRSNYVIAEKRERGKPSTIVAILRNQIREYPDQPLDLNKRLGLPSPPDRVSLPTVKRPIVLKALIPEQNHRTGTLQQFAELKSSEMLLVNQTAMTSALMHLNIDLPGVNLFPLLLALMEAHGGLAYSGYRTSDGHLAANQFYEMDTHGEARIRYFKRLGFEVVTEPIDDPHLEGAKTVKMRVERNALLDALIPIFRQGLGGQDVRFNPLPLTRFDCDTLKRSQMYPVSR